MRTESIKKAAMRRKYHVRKKVFGMPDRPRLSVFRSNRHIYAQIVDDVAGATLASASTRDKGLQDQVRRSQNRHLALVLSVFASIETDINFTAEPRLLLRRQEKRDWFFNFLLGLE